MVHFLFYFIFLFIYSFTTSIQFKLLKYILFYHFLSLQAIQIISSDTVKNDTNFIIKRFMFKINDNKKLWINKPWLFKYFILSRSFDYIFSLIHDLIIIK